MTVENKDQAQSRSPRRRIEFGSFGLSNATRQISKPSQRRLLLILLVAVFLLWEVFTRSFTAYFSEDRPETALRLRATNPTALLNRAEKQLLFEERFKTQPPIVAAPAESSKSSAHTNLQNLPANDDAAQSVPVIESPPGPDLSERYAQVRSWVETALAKDPLNPRALRLLGQLSDLTQDEKRTKALMQAAARRSHHESLAVYWMVRNSFKNQDYVAALRYADILLRTRPQTLINVMPMFGRMAETPMANPELKQLLTTNPHWRPQFFQYFPKTVTDARTPLDILLSLKDTPAPPNNKDLAPYLNFLIEHRFYDLAYHTWLQFLSFDQLAGTGHLFNGSFDTDLSGLPFDWNFTRASGVTVQVAVPRDQIGERALNLQFGPGRADYRDVSQLIVLAPGRYEFRGKYRADLISERGLAWQVICADEHKTSLGQGSAVKGETPEWTDFVFSFSVPDMDDCRAQYVRLVFDARSASEQFISGSVWYDNLQISHEATGEIQETQETQQIQQ